MRRGLNWSHASVDPSLLDSIALLRQVSKQKNQYGQGEIRKGDLYSTCLDFKVQNSGQTCFGDGTLEEVGTENVLLTVYPIQVQVLPSPSQYFLSGYLSSLNK